MSNVVVALGTNLGNREGNLNKAIESISRLENTNILKISSIYETEPFGVPNKQEKYLNCCVFIETLLAPNVLMGTFLGIEASMGRLRTYRNAPRVIDIDMLLYDDLKLDSKNLILPHPRIRERAFVMMPLADIFPNKKFLNFNFASDLKKVDCSGIKKYKNQETFDLLIHRMYQ